MNTDLAEKIENSEPFASNDQQPNNPDSLLTQVEILKERLKIEERKNSLLVTQLNAEKKSPSKNRLCENMSVYVESFLLMYSYFV